MSDKEDRYFTSHLYQAKLGHVIRIGYGNYVVLEVTDSKNGSCIKLRIQRLKSSLYDEGQPLWIMIAKPNFLR